MLCWFLHESTWHFLITSCTAAWWLVLGAYNRVWHQRQLKYAQGSRSADTQAAWRSQENTIKEIKLEPKLKVLIKVGQWFFSNSTASSSAWEDGGKGDKPGEERGHPGCLDKIWRMAYCVRVPGLLGESSLFSFSCWHTLYSPSCYVRSLGISLPSVSRAYLKMFPFSHIWILRHRWNGFCRFLTLITMTFL